MINKEKVLHPARISVVGGKKLLPKVTEHSTAAPGGAGRRDIGFMLMAYGLSPGIGRLGS